MGSWQKFKEDMKKACEEGKEEGRRKGSFEYQIEKAERKSAIRKQEKAEFKARLKEYDKLGVPYCPKCKSTRVEYIERRKKLSVGRAIVGDVLAGPTGAILGGLTSKKHKGRVKCLNCGKEWKIK
nr:MAG TPA: Transcription factor S-II (TFIIS) [Caudoviricetes sp.]